MPDENETGTPPEEIPQGQQQQTPPVQPAGTPAPEVQAPTPPRAPRLEADADLERVRRLYHNLDGQLQGYVASMETFVGGLQQRLRTAEQAAQVLQGRLSQAETLGQQLQQQVDGVPALQDQANQADGLREQLDKLNLLMRYPEIVNRFVEREQPPTEEGQEPSRVRVNPTLELLMSSNLSGPAFSQQVVDFVSTLTPAGQGESPAPAAAGASLTPQPASQTEDRMARYWELYNSGQYEAALDYLMETPIDK